MVKKTYYSDSYLRHLSANVTAVDGEWVELDQTIFYPLGGVHHFLISPIPDYVEFGAITTTIAIEVVVTTVVANFFMTLRGRFSALRTSSRTAWPASTSASTVWKPTKLTVSTRLPCRKDDMVQVTPADERKLKVASLRFQASRK